jgi:thiamine biosynthesis lipoprotein
MKRKYRILWFFVGVMFVLSHLISCNGVEREFKEYSFDVFDTVSTVIGYEKDKASFDKNADDVLSLLLEYHKLYDIYKRYDGITNLADVNMHAGDGTPLKVDERIVDLLLYAKEMYTLTHGAVNVCMGSVLSLWHDKRSQGINDPENASLPDMTLLQEASQHTDIDSLIIDETASTVYVSDPDCSLDVGAIAKGYATEMAARMLEERGVSGYLLNIGGNVRIVGNKPDGTGWDLGVEDPKGEGDYIRILNIGKSTSVVTSGSYQRYYTVGGKAYHHIIDPVTLMPSDKHLSVSVICDNSAFSDAMSTALFLMETEKAMELVESIDGLEAIFITADGQIIESEGYGAFVK